ncbi:two component system sensor histidine kinase [Desulfosarcina variabilis str. Montpellier]|uniref:ATP-binding protein n=1 Tax=Desulfosarcina variabilis TaxID=2300 RepID=UPI003AFAAE9B
MNLPMRKEINCINFIGLFSFIEKYYGAWGINTVMEGLIDNPDYLVSDVDDPSRVMPIGRKQIVNMNYWVSNDFSMQLLSNVRKVVRSENPLFDAGRGAVKENLSSSALFSGRLFGPLFLARQAAKINARFNRTKRVVLKQPGRKEVSFQLHYYPGFRVTKDVCDWNLGLYTGLLHASGAEEIRSEEVKCISDGDPYCEFRLKWKESGIFNRMSRWARGWNIKGEVRKIIDDYESSLKERDRLIDKLANSEAKYKSLFESTATANAILENDLKLSLVNTEFEKITGYSKQDMDKTYTLEDIVKSKDYTTIKEYLTEEKDDTKDKSFEFKIINRDGIEKDVLGKMGRIPNSSKIVISMMDISEKKRADKERESLKIQLVRAEKMKALGLLAGGVAHDLNNVLSGIVSYPDLLLLDIPEDSPLRKPIMDIKASGVKAAAIVQDLLTLARRDISVKEVVNLNEIIGDYLKSAEYTKMMSFHQSAELVFEPDAHLLNILGSPLNLLKAVMNLVTNAAEATKDGGKIRIVTENIYLEHPISGYDTYREGDYIILSITDNGVGIPKDDIERIFEPFYSKKIIGRSGTGLGMTVVWGTVKDHDGHIDVTSEKGKGTTFQIYFPATRRKKEQKKDDAYNLSALKGNGETILVVDDVQEQRDLASSILKKLDYRVSTVGSGIDAVEMIRENSKIDIVILDMIMSPGIDGLETFRRIREIKPDQKAIIVSGFSESERVKAARRMGAGAYIRKPFLVGNLARAVKKELTQSV